MKSKSGKAPMTSPKEHEHLRSLVVDLRESEVINEVNRLLAEGDTPERILESCQQGMAIVGELYEQSRYYIAGLIMAGKIMQELSELLEPHFQQRIHGEASGKVLMATVQGDIHYIGKNLVKTLLKCHGFTVRDLGEDVSPQDILNAVLEFKPDVIGLSALLTACFDPLRDTIAHLRANLPPGVKLPPIMIGGGATDDLVRQYVRADHWAVDAISGVAICKKIVANS